SHFVVIRGVKGGQVYLADPARGHWFRTQEEFGELWNGILLAFMRADGERVAAHDLEIKPFWSRDLNELMPAELLSLQFVRAANEF
uniref:cysteine peptidase family C39 domain-containing protein n=1 Tax=Geoalkalibacter sp. TaxID=3041440 RepID=UPI00272E22E2